MEKCKYCQAELEENSTVCPSCGKDNAEAALPVEEKTESIPQAEEPSDTREEQAEAARSEEAVKNEDAAQPEEAAQPEGPQARKVEGKPTTPAIVAIAAALILLIAALVALVYSGMQKEKTESADTTPTAGQVQDTGTETGEATGDATGETQEPTIPADGNPEDVTCKGTYTAEDDAVLGATDTVVATIGDSKLTNGLLQVYYWMEVRNFLSQYGSYASYFGLDVSQSLDTQVCGLTEEGLTWQQYFLQAALESWHNYQAMASEAQKQGYVLDEEYQSVLDGMVEELETASVENGFRDAAEMITTNLGAAGTMDNYVRFTTLYYTGYGYYAQELAKYQPSEQEVSDYFDANAETFQEDGVTKDTTTVDVRHILIMPEGATSETIRTDTFSEEAWTSSEAKAKEILDAWEKGEKTEESFGELAKQHSQDEGSKENGGLYTGITEGQMVTAFNDWSFDPTRNVGDYDIVKTEFGYHIMYFCGATPVWESYARQAMENEYAQSFVNGVVDSYTMNVDYSKILLCLVQ